ncbi:MAG: hypothetical protein OXB84_06280, partial [Halobacteriovoraceae bacterium]|nr:hypothetical protein [Halobacteriovoraceae bacterium]
MCLVDLDKSGVFFKYKYWMLALMFTFTSLSSAKEKCRKPFSMITANTQKEAPRWVVIDIGSNAIRMVIASFDKNKTLVIDNRVRLPYRLGGEAFDNGSLSGKTIEEVANAFVSLKKEMNKYNVAGYRGVA